MIKTAADIYEQRIRLATRLMYDDLTAKSETRSAPETTYRIGGFRYGYLCRLIDDSELEIVAESNRAAVRKLHEKFYWRTLRLLARDLNRRRKNKVQVMPSVGWDFAGLVREDVHNAKLVGVLAFAGIMHAVHLAAGLDQARMACAQFESIFSAVEPILAALA